MHNVLRVAIYIRVSTKLQEDKYSLNAQRTELTRYAESMKWEIVDIYQDVDSGTKLEKKGLDAMLDHVEDGLIDIVLCIEQDRLSRLDTIKWEYLKDVLRDNEVKIAEPGNIVDLSNEDHEFFADFKNLYAQRTRKDYLRKTARGKRQATREGKVSGKQPSEYHFDKGTKELSINEDRAWIIPYIDNALLKEMKSVRDIMRELNKICKTPMGKNWTTKQLYDRFKNQAYHGTLIRHYKNGETIITHDVYPKLRTLETWEEIQRLIASRKTKKPAEPHFLRGTRVTCISCGRIVGVKKRYFYSNVKGVNYPHFALMHTSEVSHEKCKEKPYVHDKRIRQSLIDAVKNILTDQDTAKLYIESDFDQEELKSLSTEIKRLERQKQALSEKIDRLLHLYLSGSWSQEELDKNKLELDAQISGLEEVLKERKRKYELIESKQINYNTVAEFLSVVSRFDQLLEVEEQQELIGSLFPKATLDLKNHTLILHAQLPQEVIIDIKIRIETTDELAIRERFELAEKRYAAAQKYLNQNKGARLEEVAKGINSSLATLWRDQGQFGRFKYLAPTAKELRAERIKILKKELSKNPEISGRELHEMTGINRPAIYEIVRTEGLRT